VFDTNIVVVGNVLTAPEWRRTTKTDTVVAHFKVASTSRRVDKETGRWIDGDTLRVRVTCWRRLAENVGASITVGDPVVVVGRLYTRDWTDSDNNPRVSYEMEAVAVGHDLARGRTRLYRNRPVAISGASDGPEAEATVRGEPAEAISEPVAYGEGVPDNPEPPVFQEPPAVAPDPVAAALAGDPVAAPAGGGFEPFEKEAGDAVAAELKEIEMEVEALAESTSPRRSRRAKRETVPA
jgi:single-strand DNA-binding protein